MPFGPEATDALFQSCDFKKNMKSLTGYLSRYSNDHARVQDAAQEAMLKAWKSEHLFDPAKSSYTTWLFRIGRNTQIDMARRDRLVYLEPDDTRLDRAHEDYVEDIVHEGRIVADIKRILNDLPKNFRDVLTLSFYDGLSHSEISEKLSLPMGTVKSRLRLAYSRVAKKALELGYTKDNVF